MKKQLSRILNMVRDRLSNSSGAIEFVYTKGVSALTDESDHWIEYGVSNFDEIYHNTSEIIDMFKEFDDYNDDPSQFMHDIIAILRDFSFHSSIIGVYYFDIDGVFNEKGDRIFINTKIQNIDSIKNDYKEELSGIANNWDIKIKKERKVKWLTKVMFSCFCIKQCYDIINDNIEEEVIFPVMQSLYSNILSLQQLWIHVELLDKEGLSSLKQE